MVRRLKYIVPTAILLLAALFVATRPNGQIQEYPGVIDPIVKDGGHVFGFYLFYLSAIFLTVKTFRTFRRARLFSALGLSAGVAILTEAVQFYVPGREPTLYDLTLDSVGILLGILTVKVFRNSNREK